MTRALKISELPQKNFQYDMIDNCFYVELDHRNQPISRVPMRSVFDWIEKYAKKQGLAVIYQEAIKKGHTNRILFISGNQKKLDVYTRKNQ